MPQWCLEGEKKVLGQEHPDTLTSVDLGWFWRIPTNVNRRKRCIDKVQKERRKR